MKGFKILGFFIPAFKPNWFVIFTVVAAIGIIFSMAQLTGIDPEKNTHCTVLEGYRTGPGYKVSEKFILILQDDKGRQFDMNVSPVTYYRAMKTKHIHFMLSEQDITHKCNGGGYVGTIAILLIVWVMWGLGKVMF